MNRISRIIEAIGQPGSPLKATALFNEGWMLRLLLDHLSSDGVVQHPFAIADGAKWFSEGSLPSPFLAERRGDARGERWTNADGVVGHIKIGEKRRGDLTLLPQGTQLVVIEAKMYSPLSTGVRRCPNYDQASRYVACIAELILRAKVRPSEMSMLELFVVAPTSQIRKGIFGERLTKESIERTVRSRADKYAGARDQWYKEHFLPTLEKINLSLISWEQALEGLPPDLSKFYNRCLEANRSA